MKELVKAVTEIVAEAVTEIDKFKSKGEALTKLIQEAIELLEKIKEDDNTTDGNK